MCTLCIVLRFVERVIQNTIFSIQSDIIRTIESAYFSVAFFLFLASHFRNETQHIKLLNKLTRHETMMDSIDELFSSGYR